MRIYSLDAFKYGFRAVFKNPLLFVLALLWTKILWVCGIFLSFLVVYPFFMPVIGLVYKIIALVKKVIASGLFGKFLSFGGAQKTTEVATSLGGVLEGVAETVGKTAEGFGKVAGGAVGGVGKIVGGAGKGVGEIFGGGFSLLSAGKKLMVLYNSAKEILSEIASNPQYLLMFLMGLFLFVFLVKVLYDFILFGWMRLSLKYYDLSKGSLWSFFPRPYSFLKYVITATVFSFTCILPFFLTGLFFLIPNQTIMMVANFFAFSLSMYLGCKLWFYTYFVADKGYDVVESLRASWVTPGIVSNMIVLMFLLICPIVLSTFLIWFLPSVVALTIIGIITAIVWMAMWPALAFLYRKLTTLSMR